MIYWLPKGGFTDIYKRKYESAQQKRLNFYLCLFLRKSAVLLIKCFGKNWNVFGRKNMQIVSTLRTEG